MFQDLALAANAALFAVAAAIVWYTGSKLSLAAIVVYAAGLVVMYRSK